MSYPTLSPSDAEPKFGDPAQERAHRKRRLALAYRLFGGFGWGALGDGHISARDPERTDAFWLLRYGVPFGEATIADLVLVGPGGQVVDGEGGINMTAYNIHGPVHDARPEVTAAAHTHTQYGTPWCATNTPFSMICQEATAFFEDHAVFDDEEVQVMSPDGGKRIAAALGEAKGVLLRNHGLLSVGASVDEAVGWFLMMERVSEVHIKAGDRADPISDEAARIANREIGNVSNAWMAFQYALRAKVPDPSVVD
ncbi:MAG: class II aldolase/adducin family protein [Acidimicrobiia bacterium]|nr:class II aldolase/adducin family protein [Acidimicrobiia bacterium]